MLNVSRSTEKLRRVRLRAASVGILAVSLTAGAVGFVGMPAAAAASCDSYQLLMARGTGEPQGNEALVLGPTATKVESQVAGGSVYNVVYPASTDYVNGPTQGATDIKNHLAAQVAACPNQRFVLGGYSEGAMAVGTALKTIPAATKPKIAAIVLFGDPYYQSGKPWDAAGNATGTFSGVAGVLGGASAFPSYSSVIQDYCAPADLVCGSGASITGHLSYSSKVTQASTFIVGQLKGTAAGTGSTTPTPAPTTPAPAPTPTAGTPGTFGGFNFGSLISLLLSGLGFNLGGLFGGSPAG